MVTKQEQLEFAAKHIKKWKSGYDFAVIEKMNDGQLCVRWPSVCASGITKKEWQQERDKMNDKPEVDDSWFTYCKLPPCGITIELWFGGSFAYNCEFIAMRGNTYVVWNLDADKPDCADSLNSQFRPVRTEREKAIDEMADLIAKSVFGSAKCQAEKLYDSGYRKVKP